MKTELWQRIRIARKYAKLTQEALGERIGVSKAAVAQWEATEPDKRTQPTIENLNLLSAATTAPIEWLMSDESEVEAEWMHLATTDTDEPASPSRVAWHPVVEWEDPKDLPNNEFALVQRRSVKLSAGSGNLLFEDEPLPPLSFRADFLRRRNVTGRSNLVIVYAEGDSMVPTIADGDSVLCDRGQTEIIDGEIYAIDYGGHLRVKRLRKRFDGGVMIMSDNAGKHPLESLSVEDAQHVSILGRVLWRGGSV